MSTSKELDKEKIKRLLMSKNNQNSSVEAQPVKKKVKKTSQVQEMMQQVEENKKKIQDKENKIPVENLNLNQRKMAELESKKLNGEVLCATIGDIVKYKKEEQNERQQKDRSSKTG